MPRLSNHMRIEPTLGASPLELLRSREIAFIDSALPDIECFISGLRAEVDAVLLSAARPATQQMAAVLSAAGNLEAIHVVAHGEPGKVMFGAGALSAETLALRAQDLHAIGAALAQDGHVLLWSCRTAQGALGAHFVAALSRMLGAQVAAATGIVGAAALGGRWELDDPGARPPLTARGMATYTGVMSGALTAAWLPARPG